MMKSHNNNDVKGIQPTSSWALVSQYPELAQWESLLKTLMEAC